MTSSFIPEQEYLRALPNINLHRDRITHNNAPRTVLLRRYETNTAGFTYVLIIMQMEILACGNWKWKFWAIEIGNGNSGLWKLEMEILGYRKMRFYYAFKNRTRVPTNSW